MLFVLSTVQKVLPLLLFKLVEPGWFAVYIVFRLLAVFGGYNRRTVKSIMGYSSVFGGGWILAGVRRGGLSWLVFLGLYALALKVITVTRRGLKLTRINSVVQSPAPVLEKLNLFGALIAAGGLPPLVTFWVKIIILRELLHDSRWILALTLTGGTLWILFIYIRLAIQSLLRLRRETLRIQIFRGRSSSLLLLLAFALPWAIILSEGVTHTKFWF